MCLDDKEGILFETESLPIQSCCSVQIRRAADGLISQIFGFSDLYVTEILPDSIYSRLEKYFTASGTELDPSPELNFCLGFLVSHLQGKTVPDIGEFSFSQIQKEVCMQIDKSSILSARASSIRGVASRAESSLERYYAELLLKAGDPGLPQTKSDFVQRIKIAAGSFPYIENYVDMVEVESKTLQAFLEPPHVDCNIVFCGSGPLPFTGLLLAATIGCSVVLVDNDWEAVRLSTALINLWEERKILPSGRISVRYGDCATLPLRGKKFSSDRYAMHGSVDEKVQCDLLFFAALIPNEAKISLGKRAASLGMACPYLAMRSAHGLTARLAYIQTPKREFIEAGLRHLGTLAPCVHNFGDGTIIDDDVRPIAFFPSSILNSLEVYKGYVK